MTEISNKPADGSAPEEQPDPGCEFAIALSLFKMLEKLEDAGDHYDGWDNCMRQCMLVGRRFEAWACKHLDFAEMPGVYAYELEDGFGEAFKTLVGWEELDLSTEEDFALVAVALGFPFIQPQS